MNIKDLKTKFLVDEFEGKFLLSEKEPSRCRFVHKYLCSVTKKGARFFVDGFKPTDKLEVLEQQVKDYVKSLPYDSEYYCPRFRAGLTEELIIHDYLTSLGFDGSTADEFYVLKEKNIYKYTSQKIKLSLYGISCWGNSFQSWNDRDELVKEVRVVLHTGEYSWVEVKANREVEDIKKAIDSILKPLFVTDSVYNLEKSELLKNDGSVELSLNIINKSMEHLSMDYKSVLKEKLLAMAETL